MPGTTGNRGEELLGRLEPLVAAQGVRLVEVTLAGAGRRSVLRLTIHSPDGGVSHADCERVTRAVGEVLDREEIVEGRYLLEVSSPGTERVLKSAREFDVFRGRHVRVRTAGEAPREIVGVCAGAREDERVAVLHGDGREELFPWASLARVRLDPDAAGNEGPQGEGA